MSNPMQPDTFRTALERLELTQAAFSRFIGVTTRTVQQWIKGDAKIPAPVALFVRYMIASGTTPHEVLKAVYPKTAPGPEWERESP